jgi:copper resistance protein C
MNSTHPAVPALLPSHHRPWLRGIVLAAAAVLLTLLVVAPAHGHAHLLETSPQEGAELDEPPTQVVLTFDEAVEPAGDALVLTDGDEAVHDLEAVIGPETGQISAEVPADAAAGEHTIAWRIMAADGHVQEGDLSYTVAAPAADADEPQADTDADDPVDEPGDGIATEDADMEQDLDAEALGAPAEDDGGTGWMIGVAVLVVAAIVAGALVLGGRRRSSAPEGT